MRYLRVEPEGKLAPYDGVRPFRAVVVVEAAVSPEWQLAASKWLVRSGCLYMLAWGRQCSSCDDSVDIASIALAEAGEVSASELVMTTWHQNELLSEVFEFAKGSAVAADPQVAIAETLVFHVSSVDRSKEYLNSTQPYNKQLQRTVMDKVPGHLGQRAAAELRR
jgi:hypothetical protein